MKISKLYFAIILVGLTLASSAFASGNYRLSCDDNNIIEVPVKLTIRGTQASASGEFSGPGDAFFDVSYKNLAVLDLRTSDNNETIEQLTVTQPVVVGHNPGFALSLRAAAHGQLVGHLSMTSTDEDHMSFHGEVTCTVKEL